MAITYDEVTLQKPQEILNLQEDLGLPRPHIFQGLIMLQQNALEKLAARDR